MKKCSKCKVKKCLARFSKDRSRKDGHSPQCKNCRSERDRSQAKREYSRIYSKTPAGRNSVRRYRESAKGKAYSSEYQRQYSKTPEGHKAKYEGSRRFNLWNNYGITPQWYENVWKKQNGVCAICQNPPPNGRKLHVDHRHVDNWADLKPEDRSKHVRGLLCSSCNNGLGRFRDQPDRLRRAADYIERAEDGFGINQI